MAKQKKTEATPKEGEQTPKQTPGSADVAGFLGRFVGFGKAPQGTYKTYRKMRANPTVALARSVAMAPIRTTPWSIAHEDDADERAVELIKRQVQQHWQKLLMNILYAFDYGWMSFEKVWTVDSDGRWVYGKLKPLLVDLTTIMVDDNGAFAGLKQKDIQLNPDKCLLYSYDPEAGDLYGRSRHENIRTTAWQHWVDIADRRGQYAKKVAGIIPIIQYPEGVSPDKHGAEKSNYDLGVKVGTTLCAGGAVVMPNTLVKWATDIIKSGIDVGKLKAWSIEFLEGKGQHGKDFTDTLRHLESLMMRGWLVPERAATEGQYGTKAESETQGNLALTIAGLTLQDIIQTLNDQLVNPLLLYNFGPEAKDTVRLEPGGLEPAVQQFFRELITKVLGEPGNIDLFVKWLDVNSLFEGVGLPKAQEQLEQRLDDRPPATDDLEQSRQQGAIERAVRVMYRDYFDGVLGREA